MPKTTQYKRITRQAGGSTRRGKDKKKPGRKAGTGTKTQAPAVIGDSIYHVRFEKKRGLDIGVLQSTKSNSKRRFDDVDDFEKMYKDLLPIIRGAQAKFSSEKTSFDPFFCGMSLNDSMYMILNSFKELLPEGYDFSIELNYNEKNYFLMAHKVLEFEAYWHCFELKNTILALKEKNERLHDMFILYMANFMHYTGIEGWWAGGLGYVDVDYIVDRYEVEEEADEELLEKIRIASNDYKCGDANYYEVLLKAQPIESLKSLKTRLNKFSKNVPIVRWMCDALELMSFPCKVRDFCYVTEENEGLFFDQQVSVIWDVEDPITQEQESYLDAEAQGCGVLDPVLCMVFNGNENKDFIDVDSMGDFKQCESWPGLLTQYFKQFNKAIEDYE